MKPDFATNARPTGHRPAGHPEGMVLAFTLIILVLMALMGVSIMGGSRAELNISSNASLGRNAFATTDAAARLAALTGRILLHPELGSPDEIIDDGDSPWKVEMNMAELRKALAPAAAGEGFKKLVLDRYLGAGSVSSSANHKPHLVFKNDKGAPIAAAFLSVDRQSAAVGSGMSLAGGDAYDGGSGTALQITLVVSANGRALSKKMTGSGAFEAEGADNDEPHSVVTTIYRERL